MAANMPLAPTSALPVRLDIPGMHEGMYLPIPVQMAVPESSLDNVEFVHMRQFLRIRQRRVDKEQGAFAFKVGDGRKKKEALAIHANRRKREKNGLFARKDQESASSSQPQPLPANAADLPNADPTSSISNGSTQGAHIAEVAAAQPPHDSAEKQQEQSSGHPAKPKAARKPSSKKSQDKPEDCGICRFCLDKVTRGGTGKLKRKCQVIQRAEKLAKRQNASTAIAPGSSNNATSSPENYINNTNTNTIIISNTASNAWPHDYIEPSFDHQESVDERAHQHVSPPSITHANPRSDSTMIDHTNEQYPSPDRHISTPGERLTASVALAPPPLPAAGGGGFAVLCPPPFASFLGSASQSRASIARTHLAAPPFAAGPPQPSTLSVSSTRSAPLAPPPLPPSRPSHTHQLPPPPSSSLSLTSASSHLAPPPPPSPQQSLPPRRPPDAHTTNSSPEETSSASTAQRTLTMSWPEQYPPPPYTVASSSFSHHGVPPSAPNAAPAHSMQSSHVPPFTHPSPPPPPFGVPLTTSPHVASIRTSSAVLAPPPFIPRTLAPPPFPPPNPPAPLPPSLPPPPAFVQAPPPVHRPVGTL